MRKAASGRTNVHKIRTKLIDNAFAIKKSILIENPLCVEYANPFLPNFDELDWMEIPSEEKANEIPYEDQHESILVYNKGKVKKSDLFRLQ